MYYLPSPLFAEHTIPVPCISLLHNMYSFCSCKSVHRQFAGYMFFNNITSSLAREFRSDARGFSHYFLITYHVCFVVKRSLWIRQNCRRFFLLWNHAMWNPLSLIHRTKWTQKRLSATPDSHAVWIQRRSKFENCAVWTRHKCIEKHSNKSVINSD